MEDFYEQIMELIDAEVSENYKKRVAFYEDSNNFVSTEKTCLTNACREASKQRKGVFVYYKDVTDLSEKIKVANLSKDSVERMEKAQKNAVDYLDTIKKLALENERLNSEHCELVKQMEKIQKYSLIARIILKERRKNK